MDSCGKTFTNRWRQTVVRAGALSTTRTTTMADVEEILYVFVSLLGLISALHVNLVLFNHLHHSARSLRSLRQRLLSTERFSSALACFVGQSDSFSFFFFGFYGGCLPSFVHYRHLQIAYLMNTSLRDTRLDVNVWSRIFSNLCTCGSGFLFRLG